MRHKRYPTLFLTLGEMYLIPVECVKPYIPSQTPEEDYKWPSAITRLTVHFACGLMSDLVICKHEIQYCQLVHPYWDQVSLNNTTQTDRCTRNAMQYNNQLWHATHSTKPCIFLHSGGLMFSCFPPITHTVLYHPYVHVSGVVLFCLVFWQMYMSVLFFVCPFVGLS